MPRGGFRRHGNQEQGARMRMDAYRGSNRGGYRRNVRDHRRPVDSPRHRGDLGHVMQHARREGSSYWTKRLLEAEERDPNRWRHSGFKEMYRNELKEPREDSRSSGSSRSRSPVARPKSPTSKQRRPRPRSPPSPPSKSRDKSRGRPRTPTHKRSSSRRSESFSSSETVSSCSDESCSVCSPKHPRAHSPPSPPTPPPKKKVATKKIVRPKEENVKKAPKRKSPPPKERKKKVEVRRPKSPPPPPESSSESSSSSSDSESSSEDNIDQPRVSLSERFGKMAQWSVDRKEYDSIKMKITKDASTSGMKVVIENDSEFPITHLDQPVQTASPDRDYAFHYERRRYFFERSYARERPIGPDVPINWNDPMARYTYYRTKGLLWEIDVSFDEYIKWETWWQRFQEWLDVERAYYGEDLALENARRERERDWESYRSSNMGRTLFARELLPLPRNTPWDRPNMPIRGRGGLITRRKFLRS